MKNKIIFAVLGVLAVVVIVIGVNYFSQSQSLGAAGIGPNHYQAENFLQGLYIGASKYATKETTFSCATASWNPGSLATSTITNATSVDIALPGAVVGDLCQGSFTSATSTSIAVDCNIAATATGTMQLTNLGITNAAIDLATGTAKVCYTH